MCHVASTWTRKIIRCISTLHTQPTSNGSKLKISKKAFFSATQSRDTKCIDGVMSGLILFFEIFLNIVPGLSVTSVAN